MNKNASVPAVVSRVIGRALDQAAMHVGHANEAVERYRARVEMMVTGGETTGRPHMDRVLLGEVMRRAMGDVAQIAMVLGELLPVTEVTSTEHADILEEHKSKVAELEQLLGRYFAEMAELGGYAPGA